MRPPAALSARVVPNDMNGWPNRSTKNGNDAHRSEGPTSRPRPPDASRASRRMRSRCSRSIHCATPPPYEWPTRSTSSRSSSSSHAGDDVRVPVERVARVRSRRLAMTGEVEHEDAARARERGGHGKPGSMRIAEPVQENERRPAPELGPVKLDPPDAHEGARRGEGGSRVDRGGRHGIPEALMG